MNMGKDYGGTCRVCLESKKNLYPLSQRYSITSYIEMLNACTNILAIYGDGYSSEICSHCVRNLKNAYAFKVKAEESDKILKKNRFMHAPVKYENLDNSSPKKIVFNSLSDVREKIDGLTVKPEPKLEFKIEVLDNSHLSTAPASTFDGTNIVIADTVIKKLDYNNDDFNENQTDNILPMDLEVTFENDENNHINKNTFDIVKVARIANIEPEKKNDKTDTEHRKNKSHDSDDFEAEFLDEDIFQCNDSDDDYEPPVKKAKKKKTKIRDEAQHATHNIKIIKLNRAPNIIPINESKISYKKTKSKITPDRPNLLNIKIVKATKPLHQEKKIKIEDNPILKCSDGSQKVLELKIKNSGSTTLRKLEKLNDLKIISSKGTGSDKNRLLPNGEAGEPILLPKSNEKSGTRRCKIYRSSAPRTKMPNRMSYSQNSLKRFNLKEINGKVRAIKIVKLLKNDETKQKRLTRALKPDEVVHRSKEGKTKHICPVCGILTSNWKTHVLTHQENKKHKCELCNKSFTFKHSFDIHMKKHEGIRDHICDVCHAGFYSAKALLRHQMIHNGQRSFACTLCPRKFYVNCDLTRHMKIHLGYKPHVCPTCSMAFNAKHQLDNHLRMHTGEKPYTCEVCNVRFAYKVNLNNHVFKVHGINLKYKSIHRVTDDILKRETEAVNQARNVLLLATEAIQMHSEVEVQTSGDYNNMLDNKCGVNNY